MIGPDLGAQQSMSLVVMLIQTDLMLLYIIQ